MRVFSKLAIVGVGALMLLVSSQALAHLIIFKDGFILQGDVRQPGTHVEGISVSEGTFVLDAGARRIYFPHAEVVDVVLQSNSNADLVTLEKKVLRLQAPPVDCKFLWHLQSAGFEHSGEDVNVSRRLIDLPAPFQLPRPTDEKRHADTAVVDRPLAVA